MHAQSEPDPAPVTLSCTVALAVNIIAQQWRVPEHCIGQHRALKLPLPLQLLHITLQLLLDITAKYLREQLHYFRDLLFRHAQLLL